MFLTLASNDRQLYFKEVPLQLRISLHILSRKEIDIISLEIKSKNG